MAQVAPNADDYAATRQNIFFTANNNTPADGNLTGQCVTLEKWFSTEMANVPDPFSARGHARYVGQTLVNQGHAVEVPASDRRRGDIVCYIYGEYGHIGIQLSGGRVFEQNVNLGGVKSKVVDGETVYASRIGSENEAWRQGKNPHYYRLKTYKEGNNNMPTDAQIQDWISKEHYIGFGTPATDAVFKDWGAVLKNNFVDGSLSILAGIDSSPAALKNKPTPPSGNIGKGTYLKVDPENVITIK
jgi:hypothetical protein